MPRRVTELLLIFSSITVSLCVGEAILRVTYPLFADYMMETWRYARDLKVLAADPRIGFEQRPDSQGDYYGAHIATNHEGWRDRDYSPGHSKYRVMVLGDSITLGWGVAEEATFARQLEKRLREKWPGVDVINTGVGNYNTEMEVYAFLEKGKQFSPDMVIVAFYVNDAEEVKTVANPFEYFLKRTYLYSLLADRWLGLSVKLSSERKYLPYYSAMYAPNSVGFRRMESAFHSLARYCREAGVDLRVALIPEMHQFEPYPFASAHAAVRVIGEKAGFSTVDLLPHFRGQVPRRLWNSDEDAHPNAEGHRLIAAALYEDIFAGRESLADHVARRGPGG